MSDNKILYTFECLNLSDYELKLSLNIENSMLTTIFNAARNEFAKNKKIDASALGDPNIIEKFDVDAKYLNTIRTALGSKIKTAFKEVNKDKWQELTPQVEELYKNYITLFELKKTELEALETATPDEIEAIKQVQEEAKAKIEVVSVVTPTYSAPIGKTRKTWKFEVANIANVPKEWLMVDADKVDEWKNANKATLVDGQVVKGIKFYQATSVIA